MTCSRRGRLAAIAALLIPGLVIPPTLALAQEIPGESRLRAPDPEVLTPERAYERSQPPVPLEEPLDPKSYVCGRGDVFELHFWGRQNFVSRVTAGLTGRVFIAKVGFVDVAGKTLADAQRQMRKAVLRYYPGLNVDVALAAPRTFLVHVVGSVNGPGIYSATGIERLSRVVERAGGVRAVGRPVATKTTADARGVVQTAGRGGSIRRIEIRRRDGTTRSCDLLRYYQVGDKAENPWVLDGDTIFVPFEGLTVTVVGGVNRPGRFELIKGKDLAELVELAGGLQPDVTTRLPIRIVRRGPEERDQVLTISLKSRRGPLPAVPLQADDRVFFPQEEELQQSIYLVGAIAGASATDEATAMQRMRFQQGDTVRTVIERAGGLGTGADLKGAFVARRPPGAPPDRPPTIIPVDLEALIVRRDFAADVALEMGDTLNVPFKRHSVAVAGAVMRPGTFQFNPKLAIEQYLAYAGGTTKMAKSRSTIRVVTTEGTIKRYGDQPRLEPGDTIIVPERTFSPGEIVQMVIAGASLLIGTVALVLATRK